MICGVIDMGANSIRLSIYRVEAREAKLLLNKKETVGLASYVKNGKLSLKGLERACLVLNDFKEVLENLSITNYYVFATASLRNIDNTEEAIIYIRQKTGIRIDVLSGEEEAVLGFAGVGLVLNANCGVIVDIGGGSTEIVEYTGGEVAAASSIPIGSLNLYNRYVNKLLPSDIELEKISTDIFERLAGLNGYSISSAGTIIGIGGTVRAAAKLNNEFFEYPPSNNEICTENLEQILNHYKDRDGKMVKAILSVAPERIHTLIPGINILYNIAKYFGAEMISANRYSIREGYVSSRIIGRD
ncbi:MAG: phosphatase [Oscillospiraceae bacterium]